MGTQHCWQTRPHDRPSFPEVLSQLEDMQVHAMLKFLRSSSLLVQFVFNLAASAHGSIRASSAMRQQQSQQVRGYCSLELLFAHGLILIQNANALQQHKVIAVLP